VGTKPDQPPIRVHTEKHSLFWGIRWIAAAIGFSYLIRMARGLVLPKLLPPDRYGLAVSLLLPLTYLRYADLGVLDQLTKRLPYFRAREGEEAFRRHVNLGAAWSLGTAVIAGLGIVIASFWLHGPEAEFYRAGVRVVALVVVVQRFQYLLNIVLNAREEFRHSQIGTMLADASVFIYTVVCVVLWGPIGIVWAMFVAGLTVSLYLVSKAGLPRLDFALRRMLAMVREGLVLLWLALMELLLITLDQIFLLRYFPVSQYGLYMLGTALASFFEGPRAMLDAAQPRIMSLAGRGREDEAKTVVASTLSLFGLAAAALVAASVPAAALAVRFYLTKYRAGIGLYIVSPLLTIARAPMWLTRPYFLARNRERILILYESIGVLTIVVLCGLVVIFKGGVVGIALATACGTAVTDFFALREFEGSIVALFRKFKRYALYAASVTGAMCIYAFWRATMANEPNPINLITLAMATTLYAIGILLVAYFARSAWLEALRVVRAQPKPQEEELGIVLSEVAGDVPEGVS